MTDWVDYTFDFTNAAGAVVARGGVTQPDLWEETYYLSLEVFAPLDFTSVRQMKRRFASLYRGERLYAFVGCQPVLERFAASFGFQKHDLVTFQGHYYERTV